MGHRKIVLKTSSMTIANIMKPFYNNTLFFSD